MKSKASKRAQDARDKHRAERDALPEYRVRVVREVKDAFPPDTSSTLFRLNVQRPKRIYDLERSPSWRDCSPALDEIRGKELLLLREQAEELHRLLGEALA